MIGHHGAHEVTGGTSSKLDRAASTQGMGLRTVRVNERVKVEISFPFDREMVNALRAAVRDGLRFMGRRRGTWEVEPSVTALRGVSAFVKQAGGFEVDAEVRALAQRLVSESRVNLMESRAKVAELRIEGLRGELLPYQGAGVGYMLRNSSGVLNADEMGLGKTVQALATLLELRAWPAVVVCPASVLWNWHAEATRWVPEGVRVEVVESRGQVLTGRAQVYVISYDVLGAQVENLRALGLEAVVLDEAQYLKNWKTKRVQAVQALTKGVKVRIALTGTPVENRVQELLPVLQILGRLDDFGGLRAFQERYLGCKLEPCFIRGCKKLGPWPVEKVTFDRLRVGDELVYDGIVRPTWTVAGRADDSAPLVQAVTLNCGDGRSSVTVTEREFEGTAKWLRIVKRKVFGGLQNGRELSSKLRSFCMVRRLKREVLPELPEKRRVIVPVELSNRAEYNAAQKDVLKWVAARAMTDPAFRAEMAGLTDEEKMRRMVARARAASEKAQNAEELVRINALRRIVADGKRKAIEEWVTDFLGGEEKLVLFGIHKHIVNGIGAKWGVPVVSGETPAGKRTELVQRFQREVTGGTSSKLDRAASTPLRLFGANLRAGGVGITLTAASNVAFWELPWNPAWLLQGEDRCLRIGQRSAVTCWYFLARGTVDGFLWELGRSKIEEAGDALGDGRSGG